MGKLPRYRKLLVTTDFSDAGDVAIPHALALAGCGGGSVVLCHVLERVEPPNPLYAHYTPGKTLTPAQRRAFCTVLEDRLKSRAQQWGPAGKIKVSCRVVEARGPIHQTILKLANSERADAIVIASHGHSRAERLILGSTTDRVLRGSRIPVLVVRGG